MSTEPKTVVSACLAGDRCKYNGGDNLVPEIRTMVENGSAVKICPETLGGLPIPRVPSEIVVRPDGSRRVVDQNGKDVTEYFEKGAERSLEIVQEVGANTATLKQRSPSCGCGQIYDGSFSKKIVAGNGITTELFIINGISIISEDDI